MSEICFKNTWKVEKERDWPGTTVEAGGGRRSLDSYKFETFRIKKKKKFF